MTNCAPTAVGLMVVTVVFAIGGSFTDKGEQIVFTYDTQDFAFGDIGISGDSIKRGDYVVVCVIFHIVVQGIDYVADDIVSYVRRIVYALEEINLVFVCVSVGNDTAFGSLIEELDIAESAVCDIVDINFASGFYNVDYGDRI